LYLIRKYELGDISLNDRRLTRQAHQFSVTAAGQGGSPVDLRVVETSQEIGRARPSNTKTSSRRARQLAKGRISERCSAFMPDAYIGQFTSLLGLANLGGKKAGASENPSGGRPDIGS